ncbi:KptA family-domain-containing protein [Haematococcus lacustris]
MQQSESCHLRDLYPMKGVQPGAKRVRVDDHDVRISKAMSRILRHSPPPGAMDAQGWVPLPLLLQHLGRNVTAEQVRRVVDCNDKKRFVLDDATDPPRIRAAQGHSVQLEDPILTWVTNHEQVPLAIHVTSHQGWAAIQQDGYIKRMGRTHIHFATLPGHMRTNSWAQVLLRLDLQAALATGLQFGLSTNQVLLCEGPLPTSLLALVTREELPPEWQSGIKSRSPTSASSRSTTAG